MGCTLIESAPICVICGFNPKSMFVHAGPCTSQNASQPRRRRGLSPRRPHPILLPLPANCAFPRITHRASRLKYVKEPRRSSVYPMIDVPQPRDQRTATIIVPQLRNDVRRPATAGSKNTGQLSWPPILHSSIYIHHWLNPATFPATRKENTLVTKNSFRPDLPSSTFNPPSSFSV